MTRRPCARASAKAGGRALDADGRAVGSKPVEVSARAGAAVEDAQRPARGQRAIEHEFGKASETEKPEMPVLGGRGGGQQTIHCGNYCIRCKIPQEFRLTRRALTCFDDAGGTCCAAGDDFRLPQEAGASGHSAAAPAAASGPAQRRRRRHHRRRRQQPAPPPPPPAPTEEELFARMSLADLNAQKPLKDVFFELDKSELSDAARATLQKDADCMKKWTSDAQSRSKATPTRAARTSTTWRSANVARRRRATTSSASASIVARVSDGEQGRGTAVLHGRDRGVLGAEPARALRHYGEVDGWSL